MTLVTKKIDPNNFPCINCICKPICRHKYYSDIINDCSLLSKILVEEEGISKTNNIQEVINIINNRTGNFRCLLQKYLEPTKWEVNDKGSFLITGY